MKFETVKWPLPKTQLILTLGKGGVGKTTISGGLAYTHRARARRANLLICSTDPAPSLDDLFEKEIGATPVSVLKDPHFKALEVDSAAEYRAWSGKVKDVISQSLELQQGVMAGEAATRLSQPPEHACSVAIPRAMRITGR